jgi:DHA2 family methylenomycin A resistance protein-like MFS transporter
MTMPTMTAVVLASAPREQSGIVAGLLSASRQAGGAIGVALLGSLGRGPRLPIAATAFLLSCVVSCAWIGRPCSRLRAGMTPCCARPQAAGAADS